MKHKHKGFSEEFKRNAVSLSHNNEKSLDKTAEELGIGYSTLSKWRSEYSNKTENSLDTPKKPKDPDMLKLKKENERLKMEVDILKKAMAFYAREVL